MAPIVPGCGPGKAQGVRHGRYPQGPRRARRARRQSVRLEATTKPTWSPRSSRGDQLADLAPVVSTVTLSGDPSQSGTDVYGRLLRYTARADADVSRELFEAGAARLYDARAEHRGLWGTC